MKTQYSNPDRNPLRRAQVMLPKRSLWVQQVQGREKKVSREEKQEF
jgi:hypothetical protein